MKKTKIKKDLSNKIKEAGSGNKIRGITLISLVITIIILLILAGITIAQLSGSGLFEKTQEAKEKYQNAQEDEEDKIAKYSNEIDSYVNITRGFNNLNTTLLLEKTQCDLSSIDEWNPSTPRQVYSLKDDINNYGMVVILMEHRPTSHTYAHNLTKYIVPKIENGIIANIGVGSANALEYYEDIYYSLNNNKFNIYRRWYANWVDLSFTIYGIN